MPKSTPDRDGQLSRGAEIVRLPVQTRRTSVSPPPEGVGDLVAEGKVLRVVNTGVAEAPGGLVPIPVLAPTTGVIPVPQDVTLHGAALLVIERLAASGQSEASLDGIGRTLYRFARFCQSAYAIQNVVNVPPEVSAAFVRARGTSGEPPSVATMHSRASVLRTASRVLRELGVIDNDLTGDLKLPARSHLAVRPLDDDEIIMCQTVSVGTLFETRYPETLALAEATAVTSEIASIRVMDVDLDSGVVRLPGCKTADSRMGALTEWGLRIVAARIRRCEDPESLIAYQGSGDARAAESSAVMGLSKVLRQAGISGEPDVKVGSVRAWAGRKAFEERRRIEDAAAALGCRSLDVAARIIGWDWRGAE